MRNPSRSVLWLLAFVISLSPSLLARQTTSILQRAFPNDDTPFSVRTPTTVLEYGSTVLEIGRRLGVPIGLETQESPATEPPAARAVPPNLVLAGLNAVQAIGFLNTQFSGYEVSVGDSIVLVRPKGVVSFLDDAAPEWRLPNGTLEDALAAFEAAIGGADAPSPLPPGTHRVALGGNPVFLNMPPGRGSPPEVDLNAVYDFNIESGATFRTTLTRLAAAIGGGSWRVRHVMVEDRAATADVTLFLKSGAGLTRRLVVKR